MISKGKHENHHHVPGNDDVHDVLRSSWGACVMIIVLLLPTTHNQHQKKKFNVATLTPLDTNNNHLITIYMSTRIHSVLPLTSFPSSYLWKGDFFLWSSSCLLRDAPLLSFWLQPFYSLSFLFWHLPIAHQYIRWALFSCDWRLDKETLFSLVDVDDDHWSSGRETKKGSVMIWKWTPVSFTFSFCSVEFEFDVSSSFVWSHWESLFLSFSTFVLFCAHRVRPDPWEDDFFVFFPHDSWCLLLLITSSAFAGWWCHGWWASRQWSPWLKEKEDEEHHDHHYHQPRNKGKIEQKIYIKRKSLVILTHVKSNRRERERE